MLFILLPHKVYLISVLTLMIMLTKTTALVVLAMTVSVFAPTTVFATIAQPPEPPVVVVVPEANQEVNRDWQKHSD